MTLWGIVASEGLYRRTAHILPLSDSLMPVNDRGHGMCLSAGASVWLPCQVKLGPFSDERMVLVVADGSEWLGFVNIRWLKKQGSESNAEVLARVVAVEGPTFHARIPGNALQSELFRGRVDRAVPSDPVQA